jgi:hypothetical protein
MRLFKPLLILVVLLVAMPALAAPDHSAEICPPHAARRQGRAAAQYRVGVLYADSQDLPEAARYYKLAADQKSRGAARLAMLNCNGQGVPKNADECIRLYRLAAEAASPRRRSICGALSDGDGTSTNHGEAARFARLPPTRATARASSCSASATRPASASARIAARRCASTSWRRARATSRPESRWPGWASGWTPLRGARHGAVGTLTVSLRRQSGVLMVPAVLNEIVSTNFVVDSGASDVVIPEKSPAGPAQGRQVPRQRLHRHPDGEDRRRFGREIEDLRAALVLHQHRTLENIKASVAPATPCRCWARASCSASARGRSTTSARCCCSRNARPAR